MNSDLWHTIPKAPKESQISKSWLPIRNILRGIFIIDMLGVHTRWPNTCWGLTKWEKWHAVVTFNIRDFVLEALKMAQWVRVLLTFQVAWVWFPELTLGGSKLSIIQGISCPLLVSLGNCIHVHLHSYTYTCIHLIKKKVSRKKGILFPFLSWCQRLNPGPRSCQVGALPPSYTPTFSFVLLGLRDSPDRKTGSVCKILLWWYHEVTWSHDPTAVLACRNM